MLYYSVYGHLEVMAYEVAAGARRSPALTASACRTSRERTMARFQVAT
jgi:hypothetical protein